MNFSNLYPIRNDDRHEMNMKILAGSCLKS